MPIFCLLGLFDCFDKVTVNEDGLLFRSACGHLLRREYINALHQCMADFRIRFFDLGVFFDLRTVWICFSRYRYCPHLFSIITLNE